MCRSIFLAMTMAFLNVYGYKTHSQQKEEEQPIKTVPLLFAGLYEQDWYLLI
jgi:hypothetical protein